MATLARKLRLIIFYREQIFLFSRRHHLRSIKSNYINNYILLNSKSNTKQNLGGIRKGSWYSPAIKYIDDKQAMSWSSNVYFFKNAFKMGGGPQNVDSTERRHSRR